MAEAIDWKSPYFNRTLWLFDHLDLLGIETSEAILLLVINYFNEKGEPIYEDSLAEKTHLSSDDLDEAIELLRAKGYLELDSKNGQLEWNLQGVLGKPEEMPLNSENMIGEFQSVFGRPLSGSEMERIVQMLSEYEESMVSRALDEAAVYDKLSIGYVEHVLAAWRARGLSAEDVENGKR